MTALTEFLLNMTIGSCVTAGAIILFRLLFGNILSARSKYLLWMLLAVRLCLPVLPYSPWSLYHIPAQAEIAMEQRAYLANDQVETTAYTTPTPIPAEEVQTVEQEGLPTPSIIEAKTIFWEVLNRTNVIVYFTYQIGLIACFAGYGILLYRTRKQLYQAEPVKDEETLAVFHSVRGELGITRSIQLRYGAEPMIGGIKNPVLLIPRELLGEELRTTLVHELLHYKSGDLRIAAFQRILCCIYWFNPVVWLCFRQARKDCELACDQQVLQYGYAEQKRYAELLLHEGEMKRKIHVGTTAFGAPDLKKRIKAVVEFQKPRKWMAVLVVAVVLVVGILTMTGDTLWNTDGSETVDFRMNGDDRITLTEAGEQYVISYTLKPSNASIEFHSNNQNVATVNQKGVITAVGDGVCRITMNIGYFEATGFVRTVETAEITVNCDIPSERDLSPAGLTSSLLLNFSSLELKEAYLGTNGKTPREVLEVEWYGYVTEEFLDGFAENPLSEFYQFGAIHELQPTSTSIRRTEKEHNNGAEFNDIDFLASLTYVTDGWIEYELTLAGTIYCNSENLVEDITVDERSLQEFYDRFDTTVKETYTFNGQRTAYHFDENLEVIRSVEVKLDGVYYDRDEGTDTFYGDIILQNWPEEGENSGGELEFPEFREVRNGFTSGSIFYYDSKGYKDLGQLFISFADGGYLPKFLIALEDGTYIGSPGSTKEERQRLMDQLFAVS